MKSFFLAVPIAFYALVGGAAPNSGPCELLRDLKKPNPKLCICSESLSKLPITIPDGFSLTAACNFHQPYGDDVLGTYTFQGNVVLSGVIHWSADFDSEEGGPLLMFTDNRKIPFSQFRSVTSALTFRDLESAPRQFKAPKLTRKSNCWEAPATIQLSVLVADVGYGTDTEGMFAEQFKVLRIGRYAQCK
jgi:hypothetical protein